MSARAVQRDSRTGDRRVDRQTDIERRRRKSIELAQEFVWIFRQDVMENRNALFGQSNIKQFNLRNWLPMGLASVASVGQGSRLDTQGGADM